MLLRLSEKHGVNPAIPLCFLCGKEKNVVLLAGRLPNDEEPREMLCGIMSLVMNVKHTWNGVSFSFP